MGTLDRGIRLALAAAFVALILTNTVSGAVAIILGVLAAVFVVTSVVSFCPLYLPFKLSTRKG
jgi:uncharacterized MAPEG superfamily protein